MNLYYIIRFRIIAWFRSAFSAFKNRFRATQSEAKTALVKYVFLDIVGFTLKRTIEAQTDLIGYLDSIVKKALKRKGLNKKNLILIPTGDGMCIAIVDVRDPYDIHLIIAINILILVNMHNKSTEDEMRKFEVRIGLNQNVDNLVTDVNGNTNVAGEGINYAQRTMNQAEGNQILISQPTYETLRGREKYMNRFRQYTATAKHGRQFKVYQYIIKGKNWINIEVPKNFVPIKEAELKLTMAGAYYLAHAIKNEAYFLTKKDDIGYEHAAVILLWFLAKDSESRIKTPKHQSIFLRTWQADKAPIPAQFQYYDNIDFRVRFTLATSIINNILHKFHKCLTPSFWVFVTDKGREKLKNEYPDIWEEFSLDENA